MFDVMVVQKYSTEPHETCFVQLPMGSLSRQLIWKMYDGIFKKNLGLNFGKISI